MLFFFEGVERVTGIEPAPSAWKAEVLPLNYTRVATIIAYPDWDKMILANIWPVVKWRPRMAIVVLALTDGRVQAHGV